MFHKSGGIYMRSVGQSVAKCTARWSGASRVDINRGECVRRPNSHSPRAYQYHVASAVPRIMQRLVRSSYRSRTTQALILYEPSLGPHP